MNGEIVLPFDMQKGDSVKAQLMDSADIERTLNRMARQIVEHLDPDSSKQPALALVGMQTRGVYLAKRLQKLIRSIDGLHIDFGVLDVTMYRDDVRTRSSHPVVRKTDIMFDVNDCHIVLVDDVLFTGRTARAALDALMDLGRPASVEFLVMVDRGHRELPIMADIVGRTVPTTAGEEVRLLLQELDGEEGVWLVETRENSGTLE